MVGVNQGFLWADMNHFGAQAFIDIQNKVENSVQSGLTVLKANNNPFAICIWSVPTQVCLFQKFTP